MAEGRFPLSTPQRCALRRQGLIALRLFFEDDIESSSPSRYKAKCQSFRLDDYDDAFFISSSSIASWGKSELLVSRMAKEVSGFYGRSDFILENMKHEEKKKTIKNIGQELLQEIFILKIVEKRGNFMETEKNYAYIFLLF